MKRPPARSASTVLLLVDGELHLPVLDRLHGVAGEVDGADLDAAVHSLGGRDRRTGGDVGVEGEDAVDVLLRLQLGLDLGPALGDVGQAGGRGRRRRRCRSSW
ncbi:MAG TPA: hypothetical protein PKH97_16500 [Tetrasphaera sp.]|uniref:hypothetical protein n=1 Tax=Nostocoides sp. TaxID=1917966 RepID=UPI002C5CC9D5|nr:hypothetical protein [Tetrasphaera sp.]HNQ08765.1 hypothetical protein [Tetrasphaera sp.]